MKTKKKLIRFCVILFLFGIAQPTQAQFFKKLAKRAEEKIKQEAEHRAQRRVDRKIDKTFDKTEEKIDNVGKKKKKKKKNKNKSQETENNNANYNMDAIKQMMGQQSNASGTYSFQWKYTLKIQSDNGRNEEPMFMSYYLSPNYQPFAVKMDMSGKGAGNMDMTMVYDPTKEQMFTVMDMNGQKMVRSSKFLTADDFTNDKDLENVKVEKIGTKTIMGYRCQGFKTVTDDGTTIIYVAENTPVSFTMAVLGNTKFKPKGISPALLNKFRKGLVMEMQFTGKRKNDNVTLTCVELKKEPLTVNF